ncbi:ferroxidase fet3, partial [Coemansia helicoidea]
MRFSTALLAVAALAHAKRVVENWDITYVTTNRGLPQPAKRGVGVNGALPLPVVEAEVGDTLVLNVHNSLDVRTSLHAHGILQRGTTYFDGVPFVSDCGIAPGTNFTYEIALDQPGTFWIHGHSKEQNYDGLRTPLIVRDPADACAFDGEFVFAVEDWWPQTFDEILPVLIGPDATTSPFAQPPRALINGVDANSTGNLEFAPGATYCIRLVSMMSFPLFEFAIDEHQLLIVEVDGVRTKPFAVDSVRLAPAQRIAVMVTAKSTTASNYQYHITMFGDYLPPIAGIFPSVYNGTVVYSSDAPTAVPATIATGFLDEISIESLNGPPALVPDRAVFLNTTVGFMADRSAHESFNLVTYRDPLVPSVYSALTTGGRAINPITYGPQTNAHVFRLGEVVELLLWNPDTLPHVMHIHGHTFQFAERGYTNDTTGALRNQVAQGAFSPLQ